jgi:hypothetical protein
MFILAITAAALFIVVYGAGWSDEPVRQPVLERRANRKQQPHE